VIPVLVRASLRYLARHRWQSGLSILGIALGVAVVIAVDIANESARRAFDLSIERVAGRQPTASNRPPAASRMQSMPTCVAAAGSRRPMPRRSSRPRSGSARRPSR
jgi:hypothetical protein